MHAPRRLAWCWAAVLLLELVLPAAFEHGGARAHGEDWPQFRGPNCAGVSQSSRPLPLRFSPTENVAWHVPLGDGIGSPIVVAGRVFVTEMVDDDRVALVALDAASGRPLWRREWETGPLPEIHLSNSHASTTPAADAERVYFYFSTLGMLCVDAASGADRWRTELPVPYTVFKWGPGMSPVLYDDLVVFCQDDDLAPAIVALDRHTGAIRWRDDRDDMCVNYSHPVVCRTGASDEIVVAGTGLVIGYEPRTGRRKWFARVLLRNIKTTPVCHEGIVYISLQSGGIAAQWIASIDQAETGNRDGKVTREELQAFVGDAPVPEAFFQKTFERGDLDGDGALEGPELDRAFLPPENYAGARFDAANPAEEYILAVRGGGEGDVTDSHLVWRHTTRHTDHIVSPLVTGNRMLLVKCGGIATGFEIAGGTPLWSAKRIQNASDFFASPVAGDGKIYVAGENGVVVVLRDIAQLEILSKNDLEDSILATPAIADGRLLVRTRTGLFSFRD